jgi:endonuclease YncB( thermonuclease family)
VKIKGKILPTLFVSFFSSIICFVFVGLIYAFFIDFLGINTIDGNYMYVELFILVVFPFCGAYAGFSLCYSGKLYVRKWNLALIVAAIFGIIPVALAVLIPYFAGPIESSSRHRAFDAALWELNAREKIWWERVKKSGRQFPTDDEIDREIVTGTTGGGWDTDVGQDYTWTVGPTATGGTILFQYREGMALYRTPATLEEAAMWSKRERVPFKVSPRKRVPLLPVAGHYTCSKVESGDTILFIKNGSEARIKLLGIDAPQVPFCKNEPGQPFSRESADYLAEMILNKKVKIVLYGMQGKDRSKGVVFVENNNVNLEMIKMGLAEVDQKNRFPGFYLKPYLDAEEEARKAALGMWSLGDCYLSPWDWKTDWRARERALACE